VAAERALLIKKFAKTPIKSQMAVYENQLQYQNESQVSMSPILRAWQLRGGTTMFLVFKLTTNLIQIIYCYSIDKDA
jgi:hypothetical protein